MRKTNKMKRAIRRYQEVQDMKGGNFLPKHKWGQQVETCNDELINYIFTGSKFFEIDNFYPGGKCVYEGRIYLNSEAAFQAAKNADEGKRVIFQKMDAATSKEFGKNPLVTELRPDWDEIKDQVMYDVVKSKLKNNPRVRQQLLATGTATIIEGTYWHDTYWGIDMATGIGRNQLGITLMRLRDELRDGKI